MSIADTYVLFAFVSIDQGKESCTLCDKQQGTLFVRSFEDATYALTLMLHSRLSDKEQEDRFFNHNQDMQRHGTYRAQALHWECVQCFCETLDAWAGAQGIGLRVLTEMKADPSFYLALGREWIADKENWYPVCSITTASDVLSFIALMERGEKGNTELYHG